MVGVLKFTLKFLLLLVIICVGIVLFAGGGVVKYMVNFHSERLTGVKMSVAGAEMSILNGQLTLNNLAIANPQGYTDTNAAVIESVRVSLQPKSVLTDNMIIDFVGIGGLRAQFEGTPQDNNLMALQRQVDAHILKMKKDVESVTGGMIPAETAAPKPAATPADAAQKTVTIRQLEIKDTAIAFRPTGRLASVITQPVIQPVDDIVLTDITTQDPKATVAKIVDVVLQPLFQNIQKEVMKVFADPESLLGDVTKQVKDKVGNFLNGLFNK